MNDRISLSEFTQLVEFAEKKYPNAKVASVGTGMTDGEVHFTIWLNVDGKEIGYEIPMYKEESK